MMTAGVIATGVLMAMTAVAPAKSVPTKIVAPAAIVAAAPNR